MNITLPINRGKFEMFLLEMMKNSKKTTALGSYKQAATSATKKKVMVMKKNIFAKKTAI